MDEEGNPVDWFFIYKMPSGFRFSYKDANDKTNDPLQIHPKLLNRTSTGALGATLHQIYEGKKQNSLAYALWNDGQPYKAESSFARRFANDSEEDDGTYVDDGKAHLLTTLKGGHTKGVLAVDKQSGFYMLHSVPKFPDLRTTEFTWEASTIYAQHFLCISVDALTANKLGHHLQHINAMFFDTAFPKHLETQYPSVLEFVMKIRRSGTSVVKLTTFSGKWNFHAFAKDSSWGKDLYEDLVEPVLKTGFAWQTWRRDQGEGMTSYCSPPHTHESMNIAAMQFRGAAVGDKPERFEFTKDHSKWGLTFDETTEGAQTNLRGPGWVCLGDLNRMISQRKRGGGTMCLSWEPLRQALSAAVNGLEPCPV